MADRCLPVVGVEVSAEGVGRHYGARPDGGLLDAWLVHTGDGASVPGVDVRAVPLLMSSSEATRDLARAALDAACG
jgi:LPPG:FO 2-phospho-L-lactate transferase